MNRLKRIKANGARHKAAQRASVVKETNIIKFKLGEERDAEIERQRNHEKAARIYDAWAHKFVNVRKTAKEVVDSLNELAAELDKAITDRQFVEYVTNEIIYPALQRAHELAELVANAKVKVIGECLCKAILKAEVPQRAWMAKAFDLVCDGCGSKLPAKKCKLVKK